VFLKEIRSRPVIRTRDGSRYWVVLDEGWASDVFARPFFLFTNSRDRTFKVKKGSLRHTFTNSPLVKATSGAPGRFTLRKRVASLEECFPNVCDFDQISDGGHKLFSPSEVEVKRNGVGNLNIELRRRLVT